MISTDKLLLLSIGVFKKTNNPTTSDYPTQMVGLSYKIGEKRKIELGSQVVQIRSRVNPIQPDYVYIYI